MQLAEQEIAARELQKQLEQEEQQAMAEIRAAQEKDCAVIPAASMEQAAPAAAARGAQRAANTSDEVQKRLSLDVQTWSLVLQVFFFLSLPVFTYYPPPLLPLSFLCDCVPMCVSAPPLCATELKMCVCVCVCVCVLGPYSCRRWGLEMILR